VETALLQLGIVLFLLGLLSGFAVPKLANPRMGLTSHLEGVMNGMFLAILGLLWPQLDLSHAWLVTTFSLAVYGTYANWLATLLAGAWGAGETNMPIAAGGRRGSPFQETFINFLLISLSLAMVAASILVIIGLS
jgi:hydroxylaminobenzene mutase